MGMLGNATRKTRISSPTFLSAILEYKREEGCTLDCCVIRGMQTLCKQGRKVGNRPVLSVERFDSIIPHRKWRRALVNFILLPRVITKPLFTHQISTVQAESSFRIQGAKSTSRPSSCSISLSVLPSPKKAHIFPSFLRIIKSSHLGTRSVFNMCIMLPHHNATWPFHLTHDLQSSAQTDLVRCHV